MIPADPAYRDMDLIIDRAGDSPDRLAELLRPFAETYSIIVLDCPPSFSRLSENVFRAADVLLTPVIPTPLSLRAFEQLREHLGEGKALRRRLHPFFSMVDRRRKLHREWLETPPAALRRLLPTAIPYASAVEKMGEFRAPVAEFAAQSPVAAAYQALWQDISDRLRHLPGKRIT